jgi:hypothetical protein
VLVTGTLIAGYGMARGPQTAFADLVLAGAAASLGVAAFVGFVSARRLGTWRSLLVAIIAVSGAALFTVFTTVADMALGRTGLLALAVLCAVILVAALKLKPRTSGAP